MLKLAVNRHLIHRIKTWILSTLYRTGRTLAIFAGAVLAGYLSSWYMISVGSALTTRKVGPWTAWTAAGRPDADPYTRAHLARARIVPMSGEISRNYVARKDSEGKSLHSSCEYVLDGPVPDTPWWSLAVYDDRGRLVPNPSERYSFTSDTLARGPDGRLGITLARDARHGNWLPTGGAGRLVLQLTLLEPRVSSAEDASAAEAKYLPEIRRLQCR
jgi:hypothetical protein